jgi:diketogulonate reductase-like aldo/keto reductase
MNSLYRLNQPIQHQDLAPPPRFLYGTAWKEEKTEHLTYTALTAGFTGIDTANQRRHYDEAGVGKAIRRFLSDTAGKREKLFLQTKFTYLSSQDHCLPYQANASPTEQVEQSLQSSLDHLGTHYIDSYLLHGPSSQQGLAAIDREVWRTMEQFHKAGQMRFLGLSNINLEQLQLLLELAEIKPAFVQNRCYARQRWDLDIRQLCRSQHIIYQGFSLLTANTAVLNHPGIHKISQRLKLSAAQVIFLFALQTDMTPLTGTCNRQHMLDDLAITQFELSDQELGFIENIAC